jgi:ribonuclease BN (tRNA processing enzyme)
VGGVSADIVTHHNMTIQFIGTGGAFDLEEGNSAALITIVGKRILLDCGNTVYSALRKKNAANGIDYVLLTHLHDDHVGSVSTFIFHQKFVEQRRSQVLYPNELFKHELLGFLRFSQQDPTEHSDFLPLTAFPAPAKIGYIDTTNSHFEGMTTFAYYFEDETELLVFSGDTGNPNIVYDFLENYPINGKRIRVFHELTFFEAVKVHCFYKDLEKLAAKYETYAYHLNKNDAPADNKIPLVVDFEAFLL